MNDSSARAPGRRLREARERHNLPASRVAEQLRLEAHLLEAIESDRWEVLGPPVYARGHIRKYAEIVGLPADELLAAFGDHSSATATPSLIPAASARDLSTTRRRNPMPLYAAAAVLVVLGGLYWWFSLAPPAPRFEASSAEAAAAAGSVASAAGPEAEMPATAPAEVGTAPAPVGETASGLSAGSAPVAATAVRVAFEARFRGQSWFEVYDASGARVTFELAPGGARRQLQVQAPLRVLLGNASAVSLAVAGRTVRVPSQLVVADTAWIQIEADGAVSAAPPRRVGSGSD